MAMALTSGGRRSAGGQPHLRRMAADVDCKTWCWQGNAEPRTENAVDRVRAHIGQRQLLAFRVAGSRTVVLLYKSSEFDKARRGSRASRRKRDQAQKVLKNMNFVSCVAKLLSLGKNIGSSSVSASHHPSDHSSVCASVCSPIESCSPDNMSRRRSRRRVVD